MDKNIEVCTIDMGQYIDKSFSSPWKHHIEEVSSGRQTDTETIGGDAESSSDLERAPIPPPETGKNEVPNGGLDAWLQVVGSWVVMVDTWGLINMFGVFQDVRPV
jgi:hypothetical protein